MFLSLPPSQSLSGSPWRLAPQETPELKGTRSSARPRTRTTEKPSERVSPRWQERRGCRPACQRERRVAKTQQRVARLLGPWSHPLRWAPGCPCEFVSSRQRGWLGCNLNVFFFVCLFSLPLFPWAVKRLGHFCDHLI